MDTNHSSFLFGKFIKSFKIEKMVVLLLIHNDLFCNSVIYKLLLLYMIGNHQDTNITKHYKPLQKLVL